MFGRRKLLSGFKVMGFERSKGLAKLARKNSGCEVIEGDFETFDWQVLQLNLLTGKFFHLRAGSGIYYEFFTDMTYNEHMADCGFHFLNRRINTEHCNIKKGEFE